MKVLNTDADATIGKANAHDGEADANDGEADTPMTNYLVFTYA